MTFPSWPCLPGSPKLSEVSAIDWPLVSKRYNNFPLLYPKNERWKKIAEYYYRFSFNKLGDFETASKSPTKLSRELHSFHPKIEDVLSVFTPFDRLAIEKSGGSLGLGLNETSLDQTPIEFFVTRLNTSSKRNGGTDVPWNEIGTAIQFLKNIESVFDRHSQLLPNFIWYLNGTKNAYCERGSARWGIVFDPEAYPDDPDVKFRNKRPVYLDSSIALELHVDGVPSLTVSFAWISKKNALPTLRIKQIQMRNEKGNRWAYKLGDHIVDSIVKRFYAATRNIAELEVIQGHVLVDTYIQDYIGWLNRSKEIKERDYYLAKISKYKSMRDRVIKFYNSIFGFNLKPFSDFTAIA